MISKINHNIPAKLEDLARFVLVGREKLVAVRALIRAESHLEIASGVREQKKQEAQMLAEALLDAEVRIGELTQKIPEAHPGPRSKLELGDSAVVQPTKTETIERLGFQPKQVERFESLASHPEIVEAVKADARENDDLPTRTEVLNRIKQEQKEKDRQKKYEGPVQEHDPWLYDKDFSEVVPEEPIDLILTDPPYGIEYEEQWRKLAIWAKKHLKPNGFLVTYFGELNLPVFYAALSSQLDYYWTFCLVHKGNKQLIMPRNVFCGWKPILVYQNGLKRLKAQIEDIIEGSGREKNDHDWQQGESELEPLIDYFSRPGFIVCDPFMGSGTTLVKAAKMKRRIMGMEIEPSTFKGAVRKINELSNGK